MIRSIKTANEYVQPIAATRLWLTLLLAMKRGDMTLLEEALTCPWCIISVMGDHAGEGVDAIFHRKATDIEQAERLSGL
jgi:hypothetical protein